MSSLQNKLQQIRKHIGTDVIFVVGMQENGKIDILQARSCKRSNNLEEPEIEEADAAPPELLKKLKERLKLKTITYIG